jgi:membrane fusion protein (multidrug efflux system)
MPLRLLASLLLLGSVIAVPAWAQAPGGGPPSVGVVQVESRPVTESADFVGRVAAIDRVALTPRITAYLIERRFTEGTEVIEGDLLFRLDPAQYEAELQRQEAVLAEAQAKLANANIQLQRVQRLVGTPADKRAAVDDAIAAQRAAAAQVMSAQALLRLAEINLAYTELRAPIGGKISRASVTAGNVVGPAGGPLAMIVRQDPMDVLFPVATRALLALETQLAANGGLRSARIRVRLSDGSLHDQTGQIDYVDPTVAANTDTVMLRARLPNPPRRVTDAGRLVERGLIDGTLVSVIVEGAEPVKALAIPRSAVLSDQQGNYVYVVGAENKVEQRRIRLGQSTAALAVVTDGLKQGESIIIEGLQRVRPGATVAPTPASPRPGTS